MSEFVSALEPEFIPPPMRAFHDAVQHSFGDPLVPEALAAQREMLAEAISRAVTQQPDPPAQQAIRAYGKVIEYAWFGSIDQEPPDEIVFASAHEGDHGELLIGNNLLSTGMFNDITELLRLQFLPLLALRARNIEANKDGLLRAIQTYLAATPVGRALQQLGSNNDPLETRLDARQRSLREALIDSMVAQSVKEQQGTVSRMAMRTNPNARRTQQRGHSLLDEEPGRRRIRRSGNEIARRLATLTTDALRTIDPSIDNATRAEYDPRGYLHFYDESGEEIARHEVTEPVVVLRESFPDARTLGSDMISFDLLNTSVETSLQALGDEGPANIYASALRSYAETLYEILVAGFRLRSGDHLKSAMEMIKFPPGVALVGNYGTVDDPSSGSPIQFQQSEVFLVDEGRTLEDFEAQLAYLQRSEKSRTHVLTPTEHVGAAIDSILQDARQFLILPEGAPDEMLFAELNRLGMGDPLVECLFTLYELQARVQTDASAFAGAQSVLAKHLTYADGLDALPAGLNKPEWYTSPRDLAVAIRRALQPLITAMDSNAARPKRASKK